MTLNILSTSKINNLNNLNRDVRTRNFWMSITKLPHVQIVYSFASWSHDSRNTAWLHPQPQGKIESQRNKHIFTHHLYTIPILSNIVIETVRNFIDISNSELDTFRWQIQASKEWKLLHLEHPGAKPVSLEGGEHFRNFASMLQLQKRSLGHVSCKDHKSSQAYYQSTCWLVPYYLRHGFSNLTLTNCKHCKVWNDLDMESHGESFPTHAPLTDK